MPKRVQLSRRAGHAAEGGAVRVDRATVWGNPFRADVPHPLAISAGAQTAAEAYGMWLDGHPLLASVEPQRRARILSSVREGLRGRDLACWCGPGGPCHADILLRLANSDAPLPAFEVPPTVRPDLPGLALSVRQPWAWAIIFARKDVENRDWRRPNPGLSFRGRVAIHASSGMTQDEYDAVMPRSAPPIPPPHLLVRGAIIGHVQIMDIIRDPGRDMIKSEWFHGPVGLMLHDPVAIDPIPCAGALGFFAWRKNLTDAVTSPAVWMLPEDMRPVRPGRAKKAPSAIAPTRGLFD